MDKSRQSFPPLFALSLIKPDTEAAGEAQVELRVWLRCSKPCWGDILITAAATLYRDWNSLLLLAYLRYISVVISAGRCAEAKSHYMNVSQAAFEVYFMHIHDIRYISSAVKPTFINVKTFSLYWNSCRELLVQLYCHFHSCSFLCVTVISVETILRSWCWNSACKRKHELLTFPHIFYGKDWFSRYNHHIDFIVRVQRTKPPKAIKHFNGFSFISRSEFSKRDEISRNSQRQAQNRTHRMIHQKPDSQQSGTNTPNKSIKNH